LKYDPNKNNTLHNSKKNLTQYNDKPCTFTLRDAKYLYAECKYAKSRYAECHHSECCDAESHYAECHYAECRYGKLRGVSSSVLLKFPILVYSSEIAKIGFLNEVKSGNQFNKHFMAQNLLTDYIEDDRHFV
jgi:hypothetical protein